MVPGSNGADSSTAEATGEFALLRCKSCLNVGILSIWFATWLITIKTNWWELYSILCVNAW